VTVRVAVQTPAHSGVGEPLDYQCDRPLPPGTLVRVPLGQREVLGLVWDGDGTPAPPERSLRPVAAVLDGIAPLGAPWRRLVAFAARYYQRSLGEVALSALPPQLRTLGPAQVARRLQRPSEATAPSNATDLIALSAEQESAKAEILSKPGPFLLFGSTGSGKTEVYLRCVQAVLEQDAHAQALVMVPEINLTPQLEERFTARFGAGAVVSLHSGMTNPQRLKAWLAAHTGQARIVLGTRMAVFASLPGLALVIVDEEHDPSYKQQEGARYSARDLAVWRGHDQGAKVVLGSATPSLESWHASRPPSPEDPAGGRYQRLCMPSRIGAGALARVRRVDMNHQPRRTVFSAPLLTALQERVARGEQSLVLLNRRGYAPVLHCLDCGWKSDCPHCSAHQVFHKADRSLRCHHCGAAQHVPRACPGCGSPDIATLGRGTEQLEEQLATLLSHVQRPDGSAVRIARIDADSTRAKGALQSQLAQVHAGEVDVLVGTQMIAKGHDFRRVTLVAAVQPDGALFSSDFRAPERLFALLEQAAGRAGRDAAYLAAQGTAVRNVGADPAPPARRVRSPAHPRLPRLCRTAIARAPGGRHAPLQLPGPGARRRTHAGSRPGLPARRQPSRPGRPTPRPGACHALPPHPPGRAARGQRRTRPDAAGKPTPHRTSTLPVRLATSAAQHPPAAGAQRPGALAGGCGPAGDLTPHAPARAPAQGPPRRAGSVPLPQSRSDWRAGGSGAAAQGGIPCSICTTRCAS
jgi:primosomal protein N' (replication factor Y)